MIPEDKVTEIYFKIDEFSKNLAPSLGNIPLAVFVK